MNDTDKVENLAFDEALERLEQLAAQLEDGDIPLEESLRVYEEAVGLFRHCRTRLNSVEQKLELLTRGLDDEPLVEAIENDAADERA